MAGKVLNAEKSANNNMGVVFGVSRCLFMASRITALHRPHLSLPGMQIGVGPTESLLL